MSDVLKEDDDNQDEIVIVETPIVESSAENDNDDDDDDIDDERSTKTDDSGEDREAIRERRRLQKIERKERRDKAIARDKIEREFLLKRNDELERRLSAQEQRAHHSDLSTIDAQIQQVANELNQANYVIKEAINQGNGDDASQALIYRDNAAAKLQQLQYAKMQAAQRPIPQAPTVDQLTMHYAKEFLSENPWYDLNGGNEDSAIMLAIDQSLAKDGLNSSTPEYWQELRTRAAKRLPERFGAPKQEPKEERVTRGGPNISSGKEHAPSSTRKEVYISPERVSALKEAGVWDDPVLRQKYVKRYMEYDKSQR